MIHKIVGTILEILLVFVGIIVYLIANPLIWFYNQIMQNKTASLDSSRLGAFIALMFDFASTIKENGFKAALDQCHSNTNDPRDANLVSKPLSIIVDGIQTFGKSTVIYLENEFNPIINDYIKINYNSISKSLLNKGLTFIYLPELEKINGTDLNSIAKQFYPVLMADGKSHEDLNLTANQFNTSFFLALFGVDKIEGPVLLRSWDIDAGIGDNRLMYSSYYLPVNNMRKLHKAIKYYLNKVRSADSGIFFQLGEKKLETADDYFDNFQNDANAKLKQEFAKLLISGNEKETLQLMFHILNEAADKRPEVFSKLFPLLQKEATCLDKISRLVITKEYQILLPDYKIEIELTPLPKTVFLFFLNKPDGIYFKDLPLYKKELYEIYLKISSKSDIESIKQSIDDLINPFSNSMSEKCSRIKEGFSKKLADKFAKHYYIVGDRSKPKKIILERALIEFENQNTTL